MNVNTNFKSHILSLDQFYCVKTCTILLQSYLLNCVGHFIQMLEFYHLTKYILPSFTDQTFFPLYFFKGEMGNQFWYQNSKVGLWNFFWVGFGRNDKDLRGEKKIFWHDGFMGWHPKGRPQKIMTSGISFWDKRFIDQEVWVKMSLKKIKLQ